MTFTASEVAPHLLVLLASAAARSLVLAGVAALALAAFRVRATGARLFTWTTVLYAALAMPLLGWLLPPLAIPSPALLQTRAAQFRLARIEASGQIAPARTFRAARPTLAMSDRSAPGTPLWPAKASAASSLRGLLPDVPWTTVADGIYLLITVVLIVRIAVGTFLARRLLRAAQKIGDSRVTSRLAFRAHTSRLTFVPEAAESQCIAVPVTVGALHSTILLPTGWQEWDDAKLDAVIAHEVSHLVRRDALTQHLSLWHRAIFWFSPLAWWLDRHLAALAEQAADEAALLSGADRNHYAKTLLGFFEALHAAPRVWWQGVAMAKAGQAEQRLEKILAWGGTVTMGFKKSGMKKSIAVAIIAVAIPVVYVAASARPSNGQIAQNPAHTPGQTPPAAPAAAPTPPAPPAPANGGSWNVGISSPVPPAPVSPVGPIPPVAPLAALAGQSSISVSHGRGHSYAYGYDDEQRFVIVTGNSDSVTISGTGEDAGHAEKLRKTIPGDFIWFERDEKSYIIRDQATIERARKLWAPQEELGKKQEELGKQQEALGKKQQELGTRMEQVHVKVPDMTAELDKLRAELKQLSSGATPDQIGKLQSEIGELQSKIGEIQSHAGEEQGKLGEEMGALGEQQGKLGEQQGELGRRQGELAEQASRQMKELLDEAIKKGTAKPEADFGGGTI